MGWAARFVEANRVALAAVKGLLGAAPDPEAEARRYGEVFAARNDG